MNDYERIVLEARIERLEALIVAIYERHECRSRVREIDTDCYMRSESPSNDIVTMLQERMAQIEARNDQTRT